MKVSHLAPRVRHQTKATERRRTCTGLPNDFVRSWNVAVTCCTLACYTELLWLQVSAVKIRILANSLPRPTRFPHVTWPPSRLCLPPSDWQLVTKLRSHFGLARSPPIRRGERRWPGGFAGRQPAAATCYVSIFMPFKSATCDARASALNGSLSGDSWPVDHSPASIRSEPVLCRALPQPSANSAAFTDSLTFGKARWHQRSRWLHPNHDRSRTLTTEMD